MTNQLPPEFDHLRDDSAAQEFPFTDVSAPQRESLSANPRIGRSSTPLVAALMAVMVCVVIAIFFFSPSKLDSPKPFPTDTVAQSEEKTAQHDEKPTPTEVTEPQFAMADADQEKSSQPWPDKVADDALAQINQRLSAVERTVETLVVSNSTHMQTLESLRAEQAQLLLKMHDNESSLSGIKNRVEQLQTKVAAPKKIVSGAETVKSNTQKSVKGVSVSPSTPVQHIVPIPAAPVKPKAQLPANIRLVSLKNMNGKNIAVLRIGGDFSPMLFEGQLWNGIQLLSASVHERSAQIGFQGDEFGLVL